MGLYEQYQQEGVIREGHFILTSGRHSAYYVDKDRIYRSAAFYDTIQALTRACKQFYLPTQFVITGPAIAGAVLAAPVWAELCYQYPKQDISFVYPEKIDGVMTFRRGYNQHLYGKAVFIIEDIITTGHSVCQTADAIIACGGTVLGIISIWNRSHWFPKAFTTLALIDKAFDSWSEYKCPLCKEHKIPLTDPKEYKNVKNA